MGLQVERLLPLIKDEPEPGPQPVKRGPLLAIEDTGPCYVYRRPSNDVRLSPLKRDFWEYGKRCTITIRPALITARRGRFRGQEADEFPGGREELVLDTLKSIFLSRPSWSPEKEQFFVDVTLREVVRELAEIQHKLSVSEVADALDILSLSIREVSAYNGKKLFREPYLRAIVVDDTVSGGRRRVYFGEITKAALMALDYRSLPRAIWKGIRSKYSMRFLKKYLYFKTGMDDSRTSIIEFKLKDFLMSSGLAYNVLAHAKRKMDRALKELVEVKLIQCNFTSCPVRNPKNSRQVFDHLYTVRPAKDLALIARDAARRTKGRQSKAKMLGSDLLSEFVDQSEFRENNKKSRLAIHCREEVEPVNECTLAKLSTQASEICEICKLMYISTRGGRNLA